MKTKYYIVLLMFTAARVFALSDQEYIRNTTNSLRLNPKNIKLIYKTGDYFFKKGNYKLAAWYLSSPLLVKHPKYIFSKIKYARSLLKLKSYKLAYLNYKYLQSLKLKGKLKKIIDNDLELCLQNYIPPEEMSYNSLMFYGGVVAITPNGNKETARYAGAYYSRTKGRSTYEFNLERLNLTFNEVTNFADYNQTDYVVAYSRFTESYKNKFRILYHGNSLSVVSSNVFSSSTVLLDISHYYRSYHYYGAEFSYTLFKGDGLNDFTSTQITPKISFPISGGLSAELKYNISKTNQDIIKLKDFTSLEVLLKYNRGRFGTIFSYSTGKEKYLLKKEGFLIRNSTDLTTSEILLDMSFVLSKTKTITIGTGKREYEDSSTGNSYSSQSYSGKFLFSF